MADSGRGKTIVVMPAYNAANTLERIYNDIPHDIVDEVIKPTEQKWFFLLNYENCKIMPEAWVSYAQRGKELNIVYSLGSVRYAPGSETEADIRLRAESQDFRPNIRNTRQEALERLAELKNQLIAESRA